MATFNVHVTVAVIVSATVATNLLVTDLATPKTAICYGILGALGGILPDIDSPQSIPSRLFVNLLSLLLAGVIIINSVSHLPGWQQGLLGGLIYFSISYGLAKLMARFINHRGNCHSILAAICWGLATTATVHHLLAVRDVVAWFAGIFVMVGYLVHLVLDEIYSIDLTNRKIKTSLGSALKIVSLRHKLSTIWLIMMTIGIFLLTPNADAIIKMLWH